MRALILAAGLGTRLHPLTTARAKAAVPVNGEPLVRRVITWLAGQHVRDLVVNLHHLPGSIAAVVGDGADLGVRVRYSWETPVLGSAGGPRHALPLLLDGDRHGRFLLINGDTLTDMDLAPLIEAHRASGALVTMALIPNPRPEFYGGVLVREGRVTGFARPGALPPGAESFHFIGVQVAEGRAFSSLPDGVPAESVMGLYPELLARDPGSVAACTLDAAFKDIGTPADYLSTSLELVACEGERLIGRDVSLAPSAMVQRTAIWDRVTVGAGTRLEECVVCDDVQVPDGRQYRRVALVRYQGGAVRTGDRIEGALLVRAF